MCGKDADLMCYHRFVLLCQLALEYGNFQERGQLVYQHGHNSLVCAKQTSGRLQAEIQGACSSTKHGYSQHLSLLQCSRLLKVFCVVLY